MEGYGKDTAHNNDGLDLREMLHALEQSPFNQNKKLEIIGFDCCIMGSIEVAAAVSPYAQYMIASEEVDWMGLLIGSSWDFSFLGESLVREQNTEELIKRICELHYETIEMITKPSIVCGYRLDRVKDVCEALDGIFKNQSDIVNMSRHMKDVKTITSWGQLECVGDLYDLTSFALSMRSKSPTYSKKLLDGLDRMIVAKKTNNEGNKLNGVSFYFPTYSKDLLRRSAAQFNVFSKKHIKKSMT